MTIKCKLTYEYGIRKSIDFLENNDKMSINIKNAMLEYCRYNISQYKLIKSVELKCLITVDYSLFGNNSDVILEQIIYSNQSVIPVIINIIPIESNDDTDSFKYLTYNQSFTSTAEIIALKNLDGILISVKNDISNKYENIKITDIVLEPTIYNDYITKVFIGNESLDIDTKQFIKFKLAVGDIINVNIETGELIISNDKDNKDDHIIDYRCECGKRIKIESDKLICSNKYNMCLFDYKTIINNYLNIANDNELNEVYSNYKDEDAIQFIDYLISLPKINFYLLTNRQKCVIFNLSDDIMFENTFNIDQCLSSLTYSQGIPMKHKKEYIKIIKGLYNDK